MCVRARVYVRACAGARGEGETQTVNNKYKQQVNSVVVRMLWWWGGIEQLRWELEFMVKRSGSERRLLEREGIHSP